MSDSRIQAQERRAAEFGPIDSQQLRELSASHEVDEPLLALLLMRRECDAGHLNNEYMELATSLLSSDDNECRWQAAIVIAEFIDSSPDKVWDIIVRHADRDDPDLRTAVGTVLLDPLIQRHGAAFGPLVDQLAQRSGRFAELCRVRSDFSDE
jgi:hypothetical protein